MNFGLIERVTFGEMGITPQGVDRVDESRRTTAVDLEAVAVVPRELWLEIEAVDVPSLLCQAARSVACSSRGDSSASMAR